MPGRRTNEPCQRSRAAEWSRCDSIARSHRVSHARCWTSGTSTRFDARGRHGPQSTLKGPRVVAGAGSARDAECPSLEGSRKIPANKMRERRDSNPRPPARQAASTIATSTTFRCEIALSMRSRGRSREWPRTAERRRFPTFAACLLPEESRVDPLLTMRSFPQLVATGAGAAPHRHDDDREQSRPTARHPRPVIVQRTKRVPLSPPHAAKSPGRQFGRCGKHAS
jgi:hypothetical protein